MELITRPQFAKLLQNGLQSQNDENFVGTPVIKLFNPSGAATWLLSEVDPNDPDRAFGLCDLGMGCPELGYVSIEELSTVKGAFNLGIERDIHWVANKDLNEYAREARAEQRIVA